MNNPVEILVQAMLEPGFYDHPVDQVELIQTHISWVFLTGDYAYKLKKPVNFSFLDFTQLKQRKFYCEEELRLNRRLAPEIYLSVIPITEEGNKYQLGGQGAIIDYCVKMRQFDQQCLLNIRIEQDLLTLEQIQQLADKLSSFHNMIPHTTVDQVFGSVDEVLKPVIQNFITLKPILSDEYDIHLMEDIEQKSISRHNTLRDIFKQRKTNGYIRECHGDLHLGNIAIINNEIVIFDCIEFNERFRWIDTMSELAFIYMDLQEHQKYELASHILNRYLEKTGDYEGLAVIKFYLSYRAMVRAKVCGLQLNQQAIASEEWKRNNISMKKYLALASAYNTKEKQFIAITHGISGSGKSWISSRLANRTSAIHIRSDVERKRLFIDNPETMYSEEITELTYKHLLNIAKNIINYNFSVIVDATFLKIKYRQIFEELSKEMGIPYYILACKAKDNTILQRIRQRESDINNVSDATIDVMHKQQGFIENFSDSENKFKIEIDTSKAVDLDIISTHIDN